MIEPGDTGSIKVDQVREAIERSAYRPFEGRRRVVIIDDADAMEASAQNALLKTLEGAAVRVDLRAGDVAARRAAADGAVALPAAAVRAAGPADIAQVLMRDHGLRREDAHARRGAGRRQHRRARSRGTPRPTSRRASRAVDAGARRRADPRPRAAAGRGRALGGDKVDRDELGRRLRLVSSMLQDLGVLLSRADERDAGQRRPEARAAAAAAAFEAIARSARFQRSTGAGGARSQREPEDRRGLAGVSGVSWSFSRRQPSA